jgi:hypothetical protein
MKTKQRIGTILPRHPRSWFFAALCCAAAFSIQIVYGQELETLTEYELGEIPDQESYNGHSLFKVADVELGAGALYTVGAQPIPAGEFRINPLSGTFVFNADEAVDRKPFKVTFRAERGAETASQTIWITPNITPVAEATAIVYKGDPDAQQGDPSIHADVTTSPDCETQTWNHQSYVGETDPAKCVQKYTFEGENLYIDSDIPGGLWQTYFQQKRLDVSAVKLTAGTIVIRERVHWPQVSWEINADVLRFEDKPGRPPAAIVTTPADFPLPCDATLPCDGDVGLNGGNIAVNVEEYDAVDTGGFPSDAVRFDLSGGRGEDPGLGANGDPGESLSAMPESMIDAAQMYRSQNYYIPDEILPVEDPLWGWPGDSYTGEFYELDDENRLESGITCYYEYRHHSVLFTDLVTSLLGMSWDEEIKWESEIETILREPAADELDPCWPTDGTDALAGGTPGSGGNGGTIVATIASELLAEIAVSAGGDPGLGGTLYQGGSAGRPLTAYKISGWTYQLVDPWDSRIDSDLNVSFFGYHAFDLDRLAGDFGGWEFDAITDFDTDFEGAFQSHNPKSGTNATDPTGFPGTSGTTTNLAENPNDENLKLVARLRALARYIRDLYVNGHYDLVREEIASNMEIIAEMELESTVSDELAQLRHELQTMHYQITNHLDYFGNPNGWVPMLSFEVTASAFEKEIDRALEVLYLTYWIGEKQNSIEQKIDAMSLAGSLLEDELGNNMDSFQIVRQAVPGMLTNLAEIENQIGVDVSTLQSLDGELRRQAAQSLKETPWSKAVKMAGVVSQMLPIPYVQPMLGTIGKGASEMFSGFDPHEVEWDQINLSDVGAPIIQGAGVGTTVLKQGLDTWATSVGEDIEKYKEASEAGKLNGFVDACKKDPPPSTVVDGGVPSDAGAPKGNYDGKDNACLAQEATDLKETLGKLSGYAEQIGTGLQELSEITKESEIPEAEVERVFQELRASAPEFNVVGGSLADLMLGKQRVMQEVNAAQTHLANLTNGITHNMRALTNISAEVTNLYEIKLSYGAQMYLDEMEARAKDRLLKYHYYLAKAYQYRMLKPYEGKLDLSSLFDEFRDLADATDSDGTLSQDEFNVLKGLYTAALSEVTAAIFDELQSTPPEDTLFASFELTPGELDKLNAAGQVIINLRDRGIFARDMENIRIVDLRTLVLQVHPEKTGEYGANAQMWLTFEHSGDSLINSNGQMYWFTHYNSENVNPIAWTTAYDAFGVVSTDREEQCRVYDEFRGEGSICESTISAANESLLAYLLSEDGKDTTDLMKYSRPAAWANILVKKEVSTSSGEGMVLDKLRIDLQYDFYKKSPNHKDLEIFVLGDITPAIFLDDESGSLRDANGRGDGRGDFLRVFGPDQEVIVEASQRFGTWEFDYWRVEGGEIDPSPIIDVKLTEHTRLEAVYLNTDPNADSDGDGILDVVEDAGDPDNDGLPNYLDDDSDGDGISDAIETDDDADLDRIPNFLDLDSDADGLTDEEEGYGDSDGDGIPNFLDATEGDDGKGGDCGCDTVGQQSGVFGSLLLLIGLLGMGLRRKQRQPAA